MSAVEVFLVLCGIHCKGFSYVLPEEGWLQEGLCCCKLIYCREACCGTHVLNTADIRDFCIVGMKSAGSGARTLTAVTGDYATSVRKEGHLVAEKVAALRAEVESVCTSEVLLDQVHDIFYVVSDRCYSFVVYAGSLLSLQLQ